MVDPDGKQLGVMITEEALRLAQEMGLDLVEVAPNATPPVCRLMDYGKYRYEQAKKAREARKRQKSAELKELQFRPRIDRHDFEVKLRKARKFLENGHKVRLTVRFRGREVVHRDLGRELLDRAVEALADVGQVDMRPKMEGRTMVMVLAPRSRKRKEKEEGGEAARSSKG